MHVSSSFCFSFSSSHPFSFHSFSPFSFFSPSFLFFHFFFFLLFLNITTGRVESITIPPYKEWDTIFVCMDLYFTSRQLILVLNSQKDHVHSIYLQRFFIPDNKDRIISASTLGNYFLYLESYLWSECFSYARRNEKIKAFQFHCSVVVCL